MACSAAGMVKRRTLQDTQETPAVVPALYVGTRSL